MTLGQRLETAQRLSHTDVGRKKFWAKGPAREKFPGENVSVGLSSSNEATVLGLNDQGGE